MTFCGIGQFNHKVIYVKMSADEQHTLSKIAGIVLNSFMEMNIDVSSSRDIKPHLTFLKLSKAPAPRWKGFQKICESLYIEYKDIPFGTELLTRIDLCAMHKKKQDSGYYHCEYALNICPVNSENNRNAEQKADA